MTTSSSSLESSQTPQLPSRGIFAFMDNKKKSNTRVHPVSFELDENDENPAGEEGGENRRELEPNAAGSSRPTFFRRRRSQLSGQHNEGQSSLARRLLRKTNSTSQIESRQRRSAHNPYDDPYYSSDEDGGEGGQENDVGRALNSERASHERDDNTLRPLQAFYASSSDDAFEIFSFARHNHIDKVREFLCERGVPVDLRDQMGNTILLVACQNGLKRMAKLALRMGADINLQNHRGNTALHFCVSYGYGDTLGNYLVSKGADPMIRNAMGRTCIDGI